MNDNFTYDRRISRLANNGRGILMHFAERFSDLGSNSSLVTREFINDMARLKDISLFDVPPFYEEKFKGLQAMYFDFVNVGDSENVFHVEGFVNIEHTPNHISVTLFDEKYKAWGFGYQMSPDGPHLFNNYPKKNSLVDLHEFIGK